MRAVAYVHDRPAVWLRARNKGKYEASPIADRNVAMVFAQQRFLSVGMIVMAAMIAASEVHADSLGLRDNDTSAWMTTTFNNGDPNRIRQRCETNRDRLSAWSPASGAPSHKTGECGRLSHFRPGIRATMLSRGLWPVIE